MTTNIRARLVRLASETTGLDEARIENSIGFDDLELDSLAQLDLIVALETSFTVEIPNDFIDKMNSIDDLEAMIEQLTA